MDMDPTVSSTTAEAKQPSRLGKYHLATVAKVLLYVLLLAGVMNVYCKMKLVLQLLHTMLVGWSIMLDVLIHSDVLQGPEQLEQLVQLILSYTGGI